jgi:hypothetical protein
LNLNPNKLVVTANPETISGTIDSVLIKKSENETVFELDSTNYKFKDIITKDICFKQKKYHNTGLTEPN